MSNLQNTITPDSHLRCAFPVSSVVAHHSDRDETTQDREETGRGVASSSAAAGPPGARARVACRGPEDSVYLAFHNRRQMIATSAKILPGVCIPDFRRIHLFSYQIFKQNFTRASKKSNVTLENASWVDLVNFMKSHGLPATFDETEFGKLYAIDTALKVRIRTHDMQF